MRCRRTSSARATGRRARTPSRPPDRPHPTRVAAGAVSPPTTRRGAYFQTNQGDDDMSLDEIRDSLPDYARDIRLNLGSVLSPQGAPGLSEKQIASIALASAIAARNVELARAVEDWARGHLDDTSIAGARAAAAVMGMNNVYYRFLHLVEDQEYARLPARLRMNVIGN